MPFALDSNPSPGEISEAINYLLANLLPGLTVNQQTGQIIAPGGNTVSYLYKYLAVKYADNFDGTVGFSDLPTNKSYYGLRNTDSSVESTNPADYVWYQVAGGFGTTKFLFYITSGGRSIEFYVGTTAPSQYYVQDSGASIDLDFVTTAPSTPANFAVIRAANDASPPTNAEVLSAIGRLPINGDLCIVNYNSGVASIQYKYLGGWVIFQKILTGDLIVANSITATNIAANTITGGKIAANTVAASNMVTGTITAASGIIANLAIGTAQIQNAAVDTLQIAGQAVTVPASVSGTGSISISVNCVAGYPVFLFGAADGYGSYLTGGPVYLRSGTLSVNGSGIHTSYSANPFIDISGSYFPNEVVTTYVYTPSTTGSYTFGFSANLVNTASTLLILQTKR